MTERQPFISMNCERCGKEFAIPQSRLIAYEARGGSVRRFCSPECYNLAKSIRTASKVYGNCLKCGGPIVAKKRNDGTLRPPPKGQLYCSKSCQISCQPRERDKGVGYIDKHGYRVLIRGRQQVYEHRLMVEQKIGRKLFAEETVHHINGNRLDNRLENLELWSSRHGKGQRVEDKVEFCIEFLKLYPELLQRRGLKIVAILEEELKDRPARINHPLVENRAG